VTAAVFSSSPCRGVQPLFSFPVCFCSSFSVCSRVFSAVSDVLPSLSRLRGGAGRAGLLLVGEFCLRKASSGWFLWRLICREKEKKKNKYGEEKVRSWSVGGSQVREADGSVEGKEEEKLQRREARRRSHYMRCYGGCL